MNKSNILMSSIGAKVPFVKRLLDSKNRFDTTICLYGADIDPDCIAQHFVDSFFIMPKISMLKIEEFVEICNAKEIKYIIPSRDEDTLYFSKHQQTLQENGIFLFAPEYEVAQLCSDKLHFANSIESDFLIQTSLNIQEIDASSYVVKDRFGSGSCDIAIDVNKKDALEFAQTLKNPIYQPYIKGQEYSIDSYVNKSGKTTACIIRSRDVIYNGEAQVTTYVEDDKLKAIITDFIERLKISGHSVIQVIKQGENYFIIECNSRFGGASTLSYAMGLESFYWFLQESNNLPISFRLSSKKLKQVRVLEDKYFEC
jgi:carbamoyl-phosphate synthase large subunit